MTKTNPQIEAAIECIQLIQAVDAKIDSVNKELRVIYGDFYPQLSSMPEGLSGSVLRLLDLILGETLASYYLYERPTGGGLVVEKCGKKWPIKNISDLRKYAYHIARKK